MKRLQKTLVVMLCAAMILALSAGCNTQEKSALDKILDKGYIVWGTNAEFMPFEYRDANNNVVGVDADIAKAIADGLGVELRVEDMIFESLPAALQSGQIDFIGAGFTKNEERLQSMDFTVEYYTAVQVVLVQAGSTDIQSEDDLVGKTIGVQSGTTGDLFIASEIEGATVQRYTSLTLACQDLKNGRVDCVIGDNLPIAMIMGEIDGLALSEGIAYDEELYALAVKKGESELLKKIDEVLQKLIDDGTIEEKLNLYSTAE
jgi:ABC-type amino acid transport substrate-binding protein